jgi:hypothetical protein
MNEFSKKDMRLRWQHEVEYFKRYAQPIADWAQMPQTIEASTPAVQVNQEEPKTCSIGSVTYRDLRKDPSLGTRKVDVRVQINLCELWTLVEADSGRCFLETLNSLLGGVNEVDPRFGLRIVQCLRQGAGMLYLRARSGMENR